MGTRLSHVISGKQSESTETQLMKNNIPQFEVQSLSIIKRPLCSMRGFWLIVMVIMILMAILD